MKYLPLLLLLAACVTSESSNTSSSASSPSSSPTVSPSCYSTGVGDEPTNYYTFPDPIILHSLTGSGVAWSSLSLTAAQRSNFVTDGRLKLRVVAKPNPGRIEGLCQYEAGGEGAEYTKLQVYLRVRALSDPSDYQTKWTEVTAVGSCSTPLEFNPPVNSLQEPFVVEVRDVYNDLACIRSGGEGFGCTPPDQVYRAFQPDCVQFELQMATSWTKDFP